MTTTPAGQPDAARRLRGYLLALGVRDGAARRRIVDALLNLTGTHHADGPPRSAAALDALHRWQERVTHRIADTGHKPATRQFLASRWGTLLNEHADALNNADTEDALVAAARVMLPDPPRSPLPHAHPQDMPRQPLGNLPAVLRGEFWVGTYRWMRPFRARHQQTDLPRPAETGD